MKENPFVMKHILFINKKFEYGIRRGNCEKITHIYAKLI